MAASIPIVVRPATAADAEPIYQIHIAADDARASPAYIAESIRTRSAFERLFVAEQAGRVVGVAALRLLPCACDPEPYAELTELYVAETARRKGVGRALVQALEAEARSGGARRLVLLTAWRNSGAHAFYHAIGYRLYTLSMIRELGSTPA
jgi:GNAT superfamily N-acetyltransferase